MSIATLANWPYFTLLAGARGDPPERVLVWTKTGEHQPQENELGAGSESLGDIFGEVRQDEVRSGPLYRQQ